MRGSVQTIGSALLAFLFFIDEDRIFDIEQALAKLMLPLQRISVYRRCRMPSRGSHNTLSSWLQRATVLARPARSN